MGIHAAFEIQHVKTRFGGFHRPGFGTLLLQFIVGFGLLFKLLAPCLLFRLAHPRQTHIALHVPVLFSEVGKLQFPFVSGFALPKADRQQRQRGDGNHNRRDFGQKQAVNRYKLHRFRLY
ncbi:hypothetical protein D3C72_1789590 [compost metagenome]